MSLTEQWFPRVALAEGLTLVLLMLVAVPLKRLAGFPEMVSLVGPIHGVCFLLYVAAALNAATRGVFQMRLLPVALVAAIVPTGTWLFWRFALTRASVA